MIARLSLAAVALSGMLSACTSAESPEVVLESSEATPTLRIELDGANPNGSFGLLDRPEGPLRLSVV